MYIFLVSTQTTIRQGVETRLTYRPPIGMGYIVHHAARGTAVPDGWPLCGAVPGRPWPICSDSFLSHGQNALGSPPSGQLEARLLCLKALSGTV